MSSQLHLGKPTRSHGVVQLIQPIEDGVGGVGPFWHFQKNQKSEVVTTHRVERNQDKKTVQ